MIDIHINIGSNSGHREALIERAVAAVRSAFPEADVRCSDIVESPPWGFESPNPFLNIGVMVSLPSSAADPSPSTTHPSSAAYPSPSVARPPIATHKYVPTDRQESGSTGELADRTVFALAILHRLLAIQNEIDPAPHRDASGAYIDRAIDIDLIAIDDWVVNHPDLTLPHPRMHLRDFVLRPFHQLAPDWRHPIFTKTASEMLQYISMRKCLPCNQVMPL